MARHFENPPIVLDNRPNEYCQYLFEPWNFYRLHPPKHFKSPLDLLVAGWTHSQ